MIDDDIHEEAACDLFFMPLVKIVWSNIDDVAENFSFEELAAALRSNSMMEKFIKLQRTFRCMMRSM